MEVGRQNPGRGPAGRLEWVPLIVIEPLEGVNSLYIPLMADLSSFISYVASMIELCQEERDLLQSVLRMKSVKKKERIAQPGKISKYRSYVAAGAMRSFITGPEGQEQNISLAVEGWWIGDFGSFLLQEPGTMFVEAIENGELVQWSYESEQMLRSRIREFPAFLLKRTEFMAVIMQKRLLSYLTLSAEERYDQFATMHPDLLRRIPLYHIASFLGMSREFLSKIRHQKAAPGL